MPSNDETTGPAGSGAAPHDVTVDDRSSPPGNVAIVELIIQIQTMLSADMERVLASFNDLDELEEETPGSCETNPVGPLFHASLSYVPGDRAWHLDMYWRGRKQPVKPAIHSGAGRAALAGGNGPIG